MEEVWLHFKETRDEELRNDLVVHYSPLVKFVVGRFRAQLPEHVDQHDLTSEGVIGLISAVERFEPGRGLQFSTFAVPRILGAIKDSLRSSDWVPRSVRDELKRIDRTRAKLEDEHDRPPTDAEHCQCGLFGRLKTWTLPPRRACRVVIDRASKMRCLR